MKVFIAYASAGAGHEVAARAMAQAFTELGVATEARDILDDTPPWFRRTYARGYLHLVRRAPELWGYVYARTNHTAQRPWKRRMRILFGRAVSYPFRRRLRETAPDAVVCTHFLPLELAAEQALVPVYGIVTDFDVHALWSSRNVKRYFVASDDCARLLERRGQPRETIHITGIPVRSAFSRTYPAGAMRRRYGLDPNRPAVLFIAGGFGVGPAVEFTESLVRDMPACQALIVVGRNERLRRRVASIAMGNARIRVFGHVDTIAEMMEAVDLVVSKPGGLTCAEALARGRPLLIVNPIPGHEQRNAEYLLEHGAGVRLSDVFDAAYKIRTLFEDPARISCMKACAQELGRPHAARNIAHTVQSDYLAERLPTVLHA